MTSYTGSLLYASHHSVAGFLLTHQASILPGWGIVLAVHGHENMEGLTTSMCSSTGETSIALINRKKDSLGNKAQDNKHPTLALVPLCPSAGDSRIWDVVCFLWFFGFFSLAVLCVVNGNCVEGKLLPVRLSCWILSPS